MPGVCRLGDYCTGHDSYPSRPNDQGSENVFVNGIPVHRLGDHWITHCNPVPLCHDGVLATASNTVFVNEKGVGRIGDLVSCGSVVATGSSDVFVGD